MSFVITVKNVKTKNPKLMYPAHEKISTLSFSKPFDLKIIGIIGRAARIAITDQTMILTGWLRFKNGIILMPTIP